MPGEKESLREKIARFERWADELNRKNQTSIEDIKAMLGQKPPTDDSVVDARLAAQQAIAKATEDSARIDEQARDRLRQIKRQY